MGISKNLWVVSRLAISVTRHGRVGTMLFLKVGGHEEHKETSGWRRRGGKPAGHEENAARQERQVASKAKRSREAPSRAMIESSTPSGRSAQHRKPSDMAEAQI